MKNVPYCYDQGKELFPFYTSGTGTELQQDERKREL